MRGPIEMDTTTRREQTQGHPVEELRTMALSNETDDQQDTHEPSVKRSGRRGLVWAVAALVVLLIVAVALVVTRDRGVPAHTPSVAPTVSAAAGQAATDASWQATQGYYAAFDRISQAASMDGVDLSAVAWPAEVDAAAQWAKTLADAGQHQTGDRTTTLLSEAFAPSKDPATAGDPAYGQVTLRVCLDTSAVDLIDNATGQSVRAPASGQSEIITRSPATITAERTGGTWKVSGENVDYETSC